MKKNKKEKELPMVTCVYGIEDTQDFEKAIEYCSARKWVNGKDIMDEYFDIQDNNKEVYAIFDFPDGLMHTGAEAFYQSKFLDNPVVVDNVSKEDVFSLVFLNVHLID